MEKVLVMSMAAEKPVVIFSRSSCFMSHTIQTLINGTYGAYPAVHELDQHGRGRELEQGLKALGCNPVVPAVFIGGQLLGGANAVMEKHMEGRLKQLLIRAGAIFL